MIGALTIDTHDRGADTPRRVLERALDRFNRHPCGATLEALDSAAQACGMPDGQVSTASWAMGHLAEHQA